MQKLELIYGLDPIFKKIAKPVTIIDNTIKEYIQQMFNILYEHKGVGLGANMVGLLQRIIVIDLQNETSQPYAMINPEIIFKSNELQTFTEASLCFPGISAKVSRPKAVKVKYLDINNNEQITQASGWLATVIQHEIDYLTPILDKNISYGVPKSDNF